MVAIQSLRKAFALFGYVIVDHLTVFIVRWALQSRRGSSMKLFSSHPPPHFLELVNSGQRNPSSANLSL